MGVQEFSHVTTRRHRQGFTGLEGTERMDEVAKSVPRVARHDDDVYLDLMCLKIHWA